MNRFIIVAATVVMMASSTSFAEAQIVYGGPVVHQSAGYGQPVPLGPVITPMPHYGHPAPYPHWSQPRQPSLVSHNQFRNYNQYGGIDTWNQQVDNTYFAPGRESSRYNGTMRQVDRPVYDNWGRVIGREQGTEWYNPSTGQTHGDKSILTPNGSGGVHESQVFHSQAGEGITPIQNRK